MGFDTMSEIKKSFEIKENLKRVIFKEKLFSFYVVFFRWGVFSLLLILFFSLIEALSHFTSSTRTALTLFILFAISVGFLFIAGSSLVALFKKITFKELLEKAKRIGLTNKKVKDELSNVLSLLEEKHSEFSAELIDAAFERTLGLLNTEDLTFDGRGYFRAIGENALLSILILSSFFLAPTIKSATYRLLNFNKEFITLPEFTLKLQPLKSEVVKGDSVRLKIIASGKIPQRIDLYEKDTNQPDFVKIKSMRLRNNESLFIKRKVYLSFKLFVKAENVLSDTALVTVINPPEINSLTLEIIPPRYSGEKRYKQFDNGNVTELKGSSILFSGRCNKSLDSAWIRFSNNRIKPLKTKGKIFTGKIKLLKKRDYKIFVKDFSGKRNLFPIEYSLEPIADEYPKIEVVEPKKDIELGNEDQITTLLKLEDDFGFTKLLLKYRLDVSEFKKPGEKFKSLVIPINKGKTEQDVFYEWNLLPLKIEVNDKYSFYFELYDNDFISGPKFVKSKMFSVSLPPLEKFLSQNERNQNKSIQKLKKTLTEAKKIKEEYQKLSNELKKNKAKITWDEKRKLEDTAKKLQALAKKSEEIKKEIAEQKKELAKKNILSKETLKKYSELQKLMSKIDNKALQKVLERMQNKLQNMMRDDAQKALEDLKKNEEAFRKSLERTIKLFKRILAEQKMDELLKRTSEIAKEQKKISDALKSDSTGANRDKLTQKESNLRNKLKALEQKAKELSKMFSEMDDVPKEEMQKLSEELQQQNNPELARKGAENLMKDKVQEAMQNMQKLMKNLSNMNKQMKNMQSLMNGQMQQKVMTEMVRIINELLSLSQKEEMLKAESSSSSLSNAQSRRIAEEQNQLLSDLDVVFRQMNSLSQKTFAITPEMGNALGKAKNNMKGAISSSLDKNGRNVVRNQQSAMAALNEAANMMQTMMSQMANQQGGQGGMMSLSQQLKQMAGQQMQLNQMTQQMKGQGMSMKQAAMMQRLARQQEALRKSLDELNKEAKASGESKKIASNLERILEQMKEVVTDLQSQNLDDNLIQKQQNILSRLLDAQRSVNERDYEKKRESEAGKMFAGKSPAELNLNIEEQKSVLEKELLNAEKEGYSKDFIELIKKYYQKLKEMQK